MNRNRKECLNIISEKFDNIGVEKSFDKLLLSLEESILEISGADYGFIYKIVDNRVKILNDKSSWIEIEESIIRSVLTSKKGFFHNHIANHKSYNQRVDNPLNIEIKGVLIVPISDSRGGSVVGFIEAISSIKNSIEFSRYDIRLLSLLNPYAYNILQKEDRTSSKIDKKVIKSRTIKRKSDLEAEIREYKKEIEKLNIELLSKEREEERLKSKIKEVQADNKLKTIFEFLSGEVRYFAYEEHKIYLFLEILKNSLHYREQLELINSELNRSNFINRLANSIYIKEKMPLKLSEFNPFAVFYSIGNLYGASFASRDMLFNIFIDPKMPNLLISDVDKIKSIIVHLLNNLCCLAGVGGLVELSVIYSSNSSSLDIEIKSLKQQEKRGLFKKSRVIHSLVTEDTGLGLSVSSNLINILGGKLTLSTVRENGHLFNINIPISSVNSGEKRIFLPQKRVKVGILMGDENIEAFNNLKRYLNSFGIDDSNILIFKNHKSLNSYNFFHFICFENLFSSKIDLNRYTSISILRYLDYTNKFNYGKDIEVNEIYINSYYGMSLQKILFPEISIEEFKENTLLVKDTLLNRVINRFRIY